MRAALYARTSTNDGRQDPEVQLTELREYIARRGFEVAGEYVDRASGASTNGRAELKRLRADAKRRRVDIVVCWKFDRVARSVIDLVTFAAELEAVGCEFISLTEQIDTTSPGGRLVFHVFAAVAEFERELIRSRVKAGMNRAKAHGTKSGKPIGRPKVDPRKEAAIRRDLVRGVSIYAASRGHRTGYSVIQRIKQQLREEGLLPGSDSAAAHAVLSRRS